MSQNNKPFFQRLEERIAASSSLLCVGLDPRIARGDRAGADIVEANRRIIEETAEYTARRNLCPYP